MTANIKPQHTANTGFTLIELLVVIAIIGILAAILFPVFAQAREQGRKTACLSNQRQIGLSFALYIQDYDSGYPNTNDPYLWVGKRWRWPLMPYLAAGQREKSDNSFSSASGSPSILLCPSDTLSGTGFDATSYGYSAAFYHTPDQLDAMRIGNLRLALNKPGPGLACATQTEASIDYPAQKVLAAEWYNSHQFESGGKIGYWGHLSGSSDPGVDRWQGARIYVMPDGHAKFLHARQIHPSAEDCPDIHLTRSGLSGKDFD